MLKNDYYINPKYFEVVIRATGLLSGSNREQRIKEITRKNIWLASKCKRSNVNEEEEITNFIILRCYTLINIFSDVQAIISLLELKEYYVLAYILNEKYNLTKDKKYSLNGFMNSMLRFTISNSDISTVYAYLYKKIPEDLYLSIFNRLKELGYSLDVSAYNSILKIMAYDEVNDIINEMQSKGLSPDINTYFTLLQSEKDFNKALQYFDLIITLSNTSNNKNFRLIKKAYIKIISLSNDYSFVDEKYNELNNLLKSSKKENKLIELSIYPYLIKNCSSQEKIKELHNYIKQKYDNKSVEKTDFEYLKKINDAELFKQSFLEYITRYYKHSDAIKREKQNKYYDISEKINSLLNTLIYNFNDLNYIISIITTIKSDYNIKIQIHLYSILITKFKEIESIDFLFSQENIHSIDPKIITSIITKLDADLSVYFHKKFIVNNYTPNIYIYNSLIKNVEIDFAFQIVEEVIKNKLTIDIYTINPLLRKYKTIEELIRIIKISSDFKIYPDNRINSIVERKIYETHISEFVNFYYVNKNSLIKSISKEWYELLNKIYVNFT